MLKVPSALDRPILFFGGKGGVGKTTIAAATASRFAAQGARTLLVSTDPAHSIADLLGVDVGHEPDELAPNLFALEIDPTEATDSYIKRVKDNIAESTAPRLVEEVERQIDVARVSPGAEESALFEKFMSIVEAGGYDHIVFDTAPTGHTLRLLSLPELMTGWIAGLISQRKKVNVWGKMWRNVGGVGDDIPDRVLESLERRRDLFVRGRTKLTDADTTGFVFVVTPERLPVVETEKALEVLDKWQVPVAALLVNRVLPNRDVGEFLENRRPAERELVARILRTAGARPTFALALQSDEVAGLRAVAEIWDRIEELRGDSTK